MKVTRLLDWWERSALIGILCALMFMLGNVQVLPSMAGMLVGAIVAVAIIGLDIRLQRLEHHHEIRKASGKLFTVDGDRLTHVRPLRPDEQDDDSWG